MPRVKDPVCGMTIDSEKAAAKGVYGGAAVYFCSVACQREYQKTHKPS